MELVIKAIDSIFNGRREVRVNTNTNTMIEAVERISDVIDRDFFRISSVELDGEMLHFDYKQSVDGIVSYAYNHKMKILKENEYKRRNLLLTKLDKEFHSIVPIVDVHSLTQSERTRYTKAVLIHSNLIRLVKQSDSSVMKMVFDKKNPIKSILNR